MKTILLNSADYIIYKSQVRFLQVMHLWYTYKLWIICSIALAGIVLAAGDTFGWEELKK